MLIALYATAYACLAFYTKTLGGGVATLPALTIACMVVGFLGLLAEGLWSRLHNRQPLVCRLRLTPDVTIAGTASAVVLLASTRAYSDPGVSLLVPLLLMKGGVLLLGPTIDWLTSTPVRYRAKWTLALALVAVVAVLWGRVNVRLGLDVALLCAVLYVAAYFPKLRVMSKYRGWGGDDAASMRSLDFQVSEMTAALLVALPLSCALALTASDPAATLATTLAYLQRPGLWALAAASEGCALFGGLLFLLRSELTRNVGLSRCASLLGGFVATLILWRGGVADYCVKHVAELVGVASMLVALWVGLRREDYGVAVKLPHT